MQAFRVIYSRRRSISIQLAADGGIIVRAPQGMSEAAVRRFVDSKRSAGSRTACLGWRCADAG